MLCSISRPVSLTWYQSVSPLKDRVEEPALLWKFARVVSDCTVSDCKFLQIFNATPPLFGARDCTVSLVLSGGVREARATICVSVEDCAEESRAEEVRATLRPLTVNFFCWSRVCYFCATGSLCVERVTAVSALSIIRLLCEYPLPVSDAQEIQDLISPDLHSFLAKPSKGRLSLEGVQKDYPGPARKAKLATPVAYPFAVLKPSEVEGDITLNDINKRLRSRPRWRKSRHCCEKHCLVRANHKIAATVKELLTQHERKKN